MHSVQPSFADAVAVVALLVAIDDAVAAARGRLIVIAAATAATAVVATRGEQPRARQARASPYAGNDKRQKAARGGLFHVRVRSTTASRSES